MMIMSHTLVALEWLIIWVGEKGNEGNAKVRYVRYDDTHPCALADLAALLELKCLDSPRLPDLFLLPLLLLLLPLHRPHNNNIHIDYKASI